MVKSRLLKLLILSRMSVRNLSWNKNNSPTAFMANLHFVSRLLLMMLNVQCQIVFSLGNVESAWRTLLFHHQTGIFHSVSLTLYLVSAQTLSTIEIGQHYRKVFITFLRANPVCKWISLEFD